MVIFTHTFTQSFFFLYLSLVFCSASNVCQLGSCSRDQRSDKYCDLNCNNLLSNFDSKLPSAFFTDQEIFKESGCFPFCLSMNCTLELLSNDQCDEECNNRFCAFDLGMCGICATGCFAEELMDQKCEEASPCNTETCFFDYCECNACEPGCGLSDVSQQECKNEKCRDEKCSKLENNPCFPSCAPLCTLNFLGNGVCDPFCNNKECDYDSGDCLCSPGCNKEELETMCKGPSDPCNTIKCDLKQKKCGHCSFGCFEEMIGDSICNPECLTSECSFDKGDCECSSGCSMYHTKTDFTRLINFNIVESCYSPSCWFGLGISEDSFTRRFKILSKLMTGNSSSFSLEALPKGCDVETLKSFDLLNGPRCEISSPCYAAEALWCLGRAKDGLSGCLRSSNGTCVVCEGTMVDESCLKEESFCPRYSELNENLTQLFQESSKFIWCIREERGKVQVKPFVIRVQPALYPLLEGNGSKEKPFLSLYLAFCNVNESNTKILMAPGEFFYRFDHKVEVKGRKNLFNPLELEEPLETLSIEGEDFERPSVIFWTPGSYFNGSFDLVKIGWNGKKIFIKNIEFNGKFILLEGCSGDLEICSYCPNFKVYVNGFNEDFTWLAVDDKFNQSKWKQTSNYSEVHALEEITKRCSLYHDLDVFLFYHDAFLTSVTFTDFRNQCKSYLKAFKSLELKNVKFFKIQPSFLGTVIELAYSGESHDKLFIFDQGEVMDLNYGYEINDDIQTGSFFKADGFDTVKFIGVEFSFNVAYSNLYSNLDSILLKAVNIGELIIDSCVFRSNYLNSLLVIDMTDLKYDNLLNRGEYLNNSDNHLQIQILNSIFETTYTSNNFITLLHKSTIQNIKLANLTFNEINSFKSIIHENLDFSAKRLIDYKYNYVNDKDSLNINHNFFEIKDLTFNDCTTGTYAIQIVNYFNVTLKNIKISKLHDGSLDEISKIFKKFKENQKFLETVPRIDQITELECLGVFYLTGCEQMEITEIFIEQTKCLKNSGFGGFYFEKITKSLNLDSVQFSEIKTRGSVLSFNKINIAIHMKNLKLDKISNEIGPIISFYTCSSIKLESLITTFLEVSVSAPILIKDFQNLTMVNVEAVGLTNKLSDCGFLKLFLSSTSESWVTIKNSVFQGVKVFGNSGIFMIESLSSMHQSNIFISNITFSESKADEGLFLFLSRSVGIKNSLISDIQGFHNENSKSMVYDSHSEGVLIIKNFKLLKNFNIDTLGVAGNYKDQGLALNVSEFFVEDCSGISKVFDFFGFSSELTQIYLEDVFISFLNQSELNHVFTFQLFSVTVFINRVETSEMKTFADLSNSSLIVKIGNFQRFSSNLINALKMSFFYCIECNFFSNFAALFVISGKSYFHIEDSVIYNNSVSGIRNSLFQIESQGKNWNVFLRTAFKDNRSGKENIFELFGTKLKMVECEYYGLGQENKTFSEIVAYDSDVFLDNSIFQKENDENYGSFFYLFSRSKLEAVNSSFIRSNSSQNGGAINADDCELINISSCLFTNNTSNQKGGAIYSTKSQVIITNTSFESNQASEGSDLFLSENMFSIIESQFTNSLSTNQDQSFSIKVSGDSLIMQKVKIMDLGFPVSGLSCQSLNSILIENSIFKNIHGNSFGASLIEGTSDSGSATIINSEFTENFSGFDGGGLTLTDTSLTLINSIFFNNHAERDGGGLSLKTSKCLTCKFQILGNSIISQNFAKRDGGGIKWLNYKPEIDFQVNISNNSASYGKNLASNASHLKVLSNSLPSSIHESYSSMFENIPPGQKVEELLVLGMIDSYSQIITTDNSSILNLKSLHENMILSEKTSFKASKGLFHITGIVIKSTPGSQVSFLAETDSISEIPARNDKSSYNNSIILKGTLRTCISGETTQSSACYKCPESQYLINSGSLCKDCPTGGICPGGANIWLKPGYYRTTNESEVIYKCPISETCLGNSTGFQTECLKGYTGITCLICDKGYRKIAYGKCRLCPCDKEFYLTLIMIVVTFFTVSVVLVGATIRSALTKKSKHSIYLKIFTNYLQLVFLMSEFDMSWPQYVSALFEVQKYSVTTSDRFLALECYVDFVNMKNARFFLMLCYAVLPMIIILLSFFIWLIICFFRENYDHMKKGMPLTIIIIFFLIHPGLIKFFYSNFSCKEFDKLGTFLIDDLNFRCWTKDHIKYTLSIVLPSILLWSWAAPAFILILMIKKRKVLHKDQYKIIFGFLYNGYSQSKFYWEFMILYRKTIIICIIVFLSRLSLIAQVLTVEFVLIFSLFFQYKVKPFNSSELNQMEIQSLATANLTIYCGLYYMTKDINENIRILFFMLILIANAYFVIFWFYWIRSYVFDALIKVFPSMRDLIKKGDAFQENFNTENIRRSGTYFDENTGTWNSTFFDYNDEVEKEFEIGSMSELYYSVLFEDSEFEKILRKKESTRVMSSGIFSFDSMDIQSKKGFDGEF